MSRRVPPFLVAGIVAVAWIAAGMVTRGADPPAAAKASDWTGLDRLLAAGDYARAAQIADEIAKTPEPKRSDPDFLARKLESFRALSRRGLAELRLGQLDAAEATLAKAFRTFKDQDVQRLLSVEARKANPSIAVKIVAVELAWIDLLNLRSAVIVDRIRFAGLSRSATADAPAAPPDREEQESRERKDVERWIRELDMLGKLTAAERRTLVERFDQGGSAVTASPLARSLVGRFRPALLSGMAALAIGTLPFPVAGPAKPSSPGSDAASPEGAPPEDGRPQWLADALAGFDEASKALDEAIAAASPAGESGLRPDAKIEAALLRAELLAHRAVARWRTGDPAGARADVEAAIALRGEIAKLRKEVSPSDHPDLVWPLALAAELAVEETRRHLSAGENDRARVRVQEAASLLARAAALPIPDEHPLRGAIAALATRLEGEQADLGKALPRTDAADAAGRRVRRALDATAPAGVDL